MSKILSGEWRITSSPVFCEVKVWISHARLKPHPLYWRVPGIGQRSIIYDYPRGLGMDVEGILEARKAKYKTTDVSKEVELQYDVGMLLATDLNPLDPAAIR